MEASANARFNAPSWRTSAAFLTVAALYLCIVIWLALRTRVFMDEIWLIEWGRVFLDPNTPYSMYMFADGSSLKPPSWFGPMLAELLFRLTGSVSAFRILSAVAMLLVAGSIVRLALNRGLSAGIALTLTIVVLLDPTLVQSVVLGRPDALGFVFSIGGLCLADIGVARLLTTRKGWLLTAFGYGACVFSLSIWLSAVLMGPLIVAHWLSSWIRVQRSVGSAGRATGAFLLAPVLVAALTIDFSHLLAVSQAQAENPIFTAWTSWDVIRSIPGQLSVSLLLILPGLAVLPLIRPWWLALALAGGICLIFLSGFYPFRIPHLLMYCAAATALVIARSTTQDQLHAWQRYLRVAAVISALLLALRIAFAFSNEVRLTPGQTWLQTLPAGTGVADYSWDFYEAGRYHGLRPMRSYPGDSGDKVLVWLNDFQPDVVVRAVDANGTFVLVDDLDDKLTSAGYCSTGWFDAQGRAVSANMVPRPVPSALLWRLGLFRDHGPYAIWRRCGFTEPPRG